MLPMADGGEGTLDAILYAIPGERRSAWVSDVLGTPIQADYAVLNAQGEAIAVLEAAQVVGLNLAGQSEVFERSTFGLGELLRHCLDQDFRHMVIGLGGSSTNDGGVGLLAALGVRFYRADGAAISLNPQGLTTLHTIDWTQLDARLAECTITVLTDVDNPLCGSEGASAIFGPQKGVPTTALRILDASLQCWAQLGDAWAGRALSLEPGAGAAGGLGYALMLCGAQRYAGAEAICALLQLDAALAQADWVITGEGQTDAQTLRGKLPWIVAQHAQRAQVPVLLLSGLIEEASRSALASIFSDCYALVGEGVTRGQAMGETVKFLTARAQQIALSQWVAAR